MATPHKKTLKEAEQEYRAEAAPAIEQDLVTAVKSGDRLNSLIALRDLLAQRLKDSKSDRDIASMSRRLVQVIDEINQIQTAKGAADRQDEWRKKWGLLGAGMKRTETTNSEDETA